MALWDHHDTGRCSVILESARAGESIARAGWRRGGKPVQTLLAGDVRIRDSNWEGFCEFRGILEDLVHRLERDTTGSREGGEDSS